MRAQADRRLHRVGQRQAAGRRGLGRARAARSLPPPPPSSSSGGFHGCVVSERRNITNRHDAERHRDQVERAEDEHQLGIGRHHFGMYPPERVLYHHFASMAARSWPVRTTPRLEVTARPVEGSRSTRRLRSRGSCPASSTAAAASRHLRGRRAHAARDARARRRGARPQGRRRQRHPGDRQGRPEPSGARRGDPRRPAARRHEPADPVHRRARARRRRGGAGRRPRAAC